MTTETLGFIVELIAAIGVVASLFYLSIQIKRNESTTRAATTQELLSKSIEMLMSHTSESPAVKAACGDQLSHADQVRQDLSFFALFSHFNNAFYQNRAGKLDSEIWSMYDARTRRNVRQMPNFPSWWQAHRENFTESFRGYIEELEETHEKLREQSEKSE